MRSRPFGPSPLALGEPLPAACEGRGSPGRAFAAAPRPVDIRRRTCLAAGAAAPSSVSLGGEPRLALAQELPHLREKGGGGCLLALKRLDPLETPDDRSCLVHAPEARARGRACVCRPASTPARLRPDIRAGTRREAPRCPRARPRA